MNEEEIINKAKLIINNHREIDKMMVIEMVELVQGLLDLYNKEKEKIKELEKEIEEQDMQHELELIGKEEYTKEAMGEIIEHYYTANEDCILKSLVREKMEQDIYTNEHTILGGRRHGKTLEYGIRLGRIQMCEELLEERKEKI